MGTFDEYDDGNYELDTGLGELKEGINDLAKAGENIQKLGDSIKAKKPGLNSEPPDSNAINKDTNGPNSNSPSATNVDSRNTNQHSNDSAGESTENNNSNKETTASDTEKGNKEPKDSSSKVDKAKKGTDKGKKAAKEGAQKAEKAASAGKAASNVSKALKGMNPITRIKLKIAAILVLIKVITTLISILLFIMLFCILISILTPTSTLALFTTQFNARDNGKYDITSTISGDAKYWKEDAEQSILDGFVSWWKGIFSANDEDDTETYSSTTVGEYDPENEYKEALLYNYDVIESSLKKAYKLAVKEAKQQCRAKGYSWGRSKGSLKNNNCDSWEKVYGKSNYGDLLSAATIIMDEKLYNENPDRISYDFDKDAFKEFMSNKDNLKHLYHITYDEQDAEETEYWDITKNGKVIGQDSKTKRIKYANITIHPYSVYDLFAMGDSSTTAEWDANIDNYGFMKERTRQIEALGDEEIYDLYHLDCITSENTVRDTDTVSEINSDYITLEGVTGSNAEILWTYLKNYELSDIAAAGVMGNISWESGFSTAWRGEGGSVGFAQWAGGRKSALASFAENMGLEKTDPNAQAAYLISELRGQMSGYTVTVNGQSMNAYNALLSATSVEEACDIFCIAFERPANYTNEASWAKGRYGINPSVEGYKYYIPWEKFIHTSINGRYYLHLNFRRDRAQQYYNTMRGGE